LFILCIIIIFCNGCGGGGNSSNPNTENQITNVDEEYLQEAYSVLSQGYIYGNVQPPLTSDTLESYINRLRSETDLYTRYINSEEMEAAISDNEASGTLKIYKIEPDILYISVDKMSAGMAETVMLNVNHYMYEFECNSLILDLRYCNNGGLGEYIKLLAGFTHKTYSNELVAAINNTAFAFSDFADMSVQTENTWLHKNNMCILTSACTFQFAEIFVSAMKYYSEATIFGSKTFGAFRAVQAYKFYRGDGFNYTAGIIYDIYGVEKEGIGITPDHNTTQPINDAIEFLGGDTTSFYDRIFQDYNIRQEIRNVFYDRDELRNLYLMR